MKRIITIQDLSCVGKCSLTVALPIISAAGVETCALPTAVLSTHTAFSHYTYHDLTDEIRPISDVFTTLQLDFDAIYTGYLGSVHQVEEVETFIDRFRKEGTAVIIDPVIGDFGNLYQGFDQNFADRMARLCKKADLILPNLTEASYMLRIPYRETYDEPYIRDVLLRLAGRGIRRIALTGVSLEEDKIGFYFYDAAENRFFSYMNEKHPAVYHGTGDIFASAVTGAYMRGFCMEDALKLAVDFVLHCVRCTEEDPGHRFYGVNFEAALPYYIESLQTEK